MEGSLICLFRHLRTKTGVVKSGNELKSSQNEEQSSGGGEADTNKEGQEVITGELQGWGLGERRGG